MSGLPVTPKRTDNEIQLLGRQYGSCSAPKRNSPLRRINPIRTVAKNIPTKWEQVKIITQEDSANPRFIAHEENYPRSNGQLKENNRLTFTVRKDSPQLIGNHLISKLNSICILNDGSVINEIVDKGQLDRADAGFMDETNQQESSSPVVELQPEPSEFLPDDSGHGDSFSTAAPMSDDIVETGLENFVEVLNINDVDTEDTSTNSVETLQISKDFERKRRNVIAKTTPIKASGSPAQIRSKVNNDSKLSYNEKLYVTRFGRTVKPPVKLGYS